MLLYLDLWQTPATTAEKKQFLAGLILTIEVSPVVGGKRELKKPEESLG